MVKHSTWLLPPGFGLHLDGKGKREQSLFNQACELLRKAILDGTLPSGSRLPSTRGLADEWRISRNTVIGAFEQLTMEGYLEARVGAGTYVTRALPDELLQVSPRAPARALAEKPQRLPMAKWATSIKSIPRRVRSIDTPLPFRIGYPAVDLFPRRLWQKLYDHRLLNARRALLAYGDHRGLPALREAISQYAGLARGVHCSSEQIVITTGSQQAVHLTARLLLEEGSSIIIEDPGYLDIRAQALSLGAKLIPMPIDEEGLVIPKARIPSARVVFVTPSHQYPCGQTMSLARRLELLAWAKRHKCWIVEDDYDGELRYQGAPIPSLQGLDRSNRVIYCGTFSKLLFPALRLGYIVLPPQLLESFLAAKALSDTHCPSIEQAVLADFISQGHLVRHLRKMRRVYQERQQVLLAALEEYAQDLLIAIPHSAGMHLTVRLKGMSDARAAASCRANGLDVLPLSTFSLKYAPYEGLLLGYAGFDNSALRSGARHLTEALSEVKHR